MRAGWFRVCPLIWALASMPASAQPARDKYVEAFLGFARSVAPRKGTITVEREAGGDAFGRSVVGLDAATGAWFSASNREYLGRSASGYAFEGDPLGEGPVPRVRPWGAPMLGTGSEIPFAYVLSALEDPAILRWAEPHEEGGWRFAIAIPSTAPEERLLEVTVDRSGRPVMVQAEGRAARELEYLPEAIGPLGVVKNKAHDQIIGRRYTVQVMPDGRPELFEPEVVHEVAKDCYYRVEVKKRARSAGFVQADGTTGWASAQTEAAPYAGRSVGAYRWPLIVGGALVVVLAGLEMWRRKRSG